MSARPQIGSGNLRNGPSGPRRAHGSRLMSALLNGRLFLSSYSPLFCLLGLRFENRNLAIACFLIAILSAGDLYLNLFLSRRIAPGSYVVTNVEDRGAEVAGYLATYLLPFLTVPQPTVRELAAYGLFILVAGLIYVRSQMVQVNPLLYVFGLRLSSIQTEGGLSSYLISRSTPKVGSTLRAVRLRNYLLLQK
jgi:hypothetical protein